MPSPCARRAFGIAAAACTARRSVYELSYAVESTASAPRRAASAARSYTASSEPIADMRSTHAATHFVRASSSRSARASGDASTTSSSSAIGMPVRADSRASSDGSASGSSRYSMRAGSTPRSSSAQDARLMRRFPSRRRRACGSASSARARSARSSAAEARPILSFTDRTPRSRATSPSVSSAAPAPKKPATSASRTMPLAKPWLVASAHDTANAALGGSSSTSRRPSIQSSIAASASSRSSRWSPGSGAHSPNPTRPVTSSSMRRNATSRDAPPTIARANGWTSSETRRIGSITAPPRSRARRSRTPRRRGRASRRSRRACDSARRHRGP